MISIALSAVFRIPAGEVNLRNRRGDDSSLGGSSDDSLLVKRDSPHNRGIPECGMFVEQKE